MNYIVCVTNFHMVIAKAISLGWCPSSYSIIDLRRRGNISSWRVLVAGRCCAIAKLVRCIFDSDSHALVSHPYNLWFSIFIRVSRKTSFYDDGIAYYNNSRVPRGLTPTVYALLSRKVNPKLNSFEEKFGYADILKTAKIEKYYCLYPELFSNCSDFFVSKIQSINSSLSEVVKSESKSTVDGVAILLDSMPEVAAHYDALALFKYFELRYSASNVKFYYKPHPAKSTLLSDLFSKASWVQDVDVGFEDFVAENKVLDLYSFYSSASIVARVYSSETKIHCLSSENAQGLFVGLAPLMKVLGAEELRVES